MSKGRKGLDDARFKHIQSDPLFGGLKNTDKKVVIDKRFAAALTDERFSSRAKVDMRGRKTKKSTGNDMLDLYEVEGEKKKKKDDVGDFFNEEDDDEEEVDGVDEEEEESSEDDEETTAKRKLDLARGEGNLSSSSDDSDSEDEETEVGNGIFTSADKVQLEIDLAHLDKEVETVEWTSRRLALCNLEWDNVNCEDVYMMAKSFLPPGGSIKSVGIYLSDFGKEQLDKEEQNGPPIKLTKPIEEYKEGEMDDETKLAIRKYLVDKLKYYYAVIECDTDESAAAVYEQCNGIQFEETGLKLDLRFIPDDMDFEEDRLKERLTPESLNEQKYKPKKNNTIAISSTKAKITWDEDDPQRKRKMKDAFGDNEDAGRDLIADSDDDSDDEESAKNRNALLSLLKGDSSEKAFDVEWDDKTGENDESDDSADEYVKIDEDAEEIGIAPKRRKTEEEDEEEEEVEEQATSLKKNGYQEYKDRKKAKKMEKKLASKKSGTPLTIASASIASNVKTDDRFKALFTDSAFAIEQTSKDFKGSSLVASQAKKKATDRSAVLEAAAKTASPAVTGRSLVEKLKKKSAKWK